jgi:Leucine-rich repeat (LRR) protein
MVCPSHTHSFLSHAQIRIVENLEGLHELRILTLSHNQIVSLAGLAADRFQVQRGARLTRLDVRHNLLGAFASAEIDTSGAVTAGRNRIGTARRAHGAGTLADGSDRGEDGHDEDDDGILAARSVFDALSACTALRELALHGNDRLLHTLSSASVGSVASHVGDSDAD